MKPVMNVLSFFIVLTLHSIGAAQTFQKKALTLEGAKKVIAAAVAEAKNKNAPGGAIAVIDEGGNLIAVERLDNTFAAGANISIGKARTAVLFKRHEVFRRRDQQGTDGDDNASRLHLAAGRHTDHRRWTDHWSGGHGWLHRGQTSRSQRRSCQTRSGNRPHRSA